MAFYANLKGIFHNCSMCDGNAVLARLILLSDGAKGLSEAFSAIKMNSNRDGHHEILAGGYQRLHILILDQKRAPRKHMVLKLGSFKNWTKKTENRHSSF